MDSGDQMRGAQKEQAPRSDEHDAGGEAGQTPAGARIVDEALVGDDEEFSDRDQTASDRDQTYSERDQTSADRDARASREDQFASDLEMSEGADQRSRDMGALQRKRATELRAQEASARMRTGRERDITASDRDATASVRDRGASTRDDSAIRRAESKLLGMRDEDAERDREQAAAARSAAADVRDVAARNRHLAAAHRSDPAAVTGLGDLDALTNLLPRETGMSHLAREILLKQRTPESLAVVVVHVSGVGQLNDQQGRSAGDELLVSVANALSESLRPCDAVMRFAANEFACVIPDADEPVQRHIADRVGELASLAPGVEITIGNADFVDGQSAIEMVRRAAANRRVPPAGP